MFGVFTNLQQGKLRNKCMHVVTYIKIPWSLYACRPDFCQAAVWRSRSNIVLLSVVTSSVSEFSGCIAFLAVKDRVPRY